MSSSGGARATEAAAAKAGPTEAGSAEAALAKGMAAPALPAVALLGPSPLASGLRGTGGVGGKDPWDTGHCMAKARARAVPEIEAPARSGTKAAQMSHSQTMSSRLTTGHGLRLVSAPRGGRASAKRVRIQQTSYLEN